MNGIKVGILREGLNRHAQHGLQLTLSWAIEQFYVRIFLEGRVHAFLAQPPGDALESAVQVKHRPLRAPIYLLQTSDDRRARHDAALIVVEIDRDGDISASGWGVDDA